MNSEKSIIAHTTMIASVIILRTSHNDSERQLGSASVVTAGGCDKRHPVNIAGQGKFRKSDFGLNSNSDDQRDQDNQGKDCPKNMRIVPSVPESLPVISSVFGYSFSLHRIQPGSTKLMRIAKNNPVDQARKTCAKHYGYDIPLPSYHPEKCDGADSDSEPIDYAITGKNHVQGKPDGQIEHYADHGCGDGG
jgi:hypothetical protein